MGGIAMGTTEQALISNLIQSQSFPEIREILFATDFSTASITALPFAAAVARAFHSHLHLLHLVMPETYQFLPPEGISLASTSLEEDARARMRELQASNILKDVEVISSEVVKGELGLLLRRIEERNIDLLVVGTHGRQGFRRLLLGSIAEEIIRHAPCPVLTVGPHAKFSNDAGFHPRHVVFATDASADSFRALRHAVIFAKKECSDLVMVHVLTNGREGTAEANAFAALMREALHHAIPLHAIKSCSPEVLVSFGEPVEQILKAAQDRESELIVLGARSSSVKLENKHSKGVSYGVIAGANCPVLTVRGHDLR
jgi:nucleotide-binding universal stress UspA family protein